MILHELSLFTVQKPPTSKQLQEISNLLVTSLREKLGDNLYVVNKHFEESLWITTTILHTKTNDFSGICYYGIISYALRDSKPLVTAVLLKFLNENRLVDDDGTILTSEFSGTGWADFTWSVDEYREWGCSQICQIKSLENLPHPVRNDVAAQS